MTDLIERLREMYQIDSTCVEAADRIEQQSDKITALTHDVELRDRRIEQLEAELQAQRESTDIFRKLASPAPKPEVAFKNNIFGAKQKKCTTDGCDWQATDHIIMGGIGSDYCIDCADKIIAKYKGERS